MAREYAMGYSPCSDNGVICESVKGGRPCGETPDGEGSSHMASFLIPGSRGAGPGSPHGTEEVARSSAQTSQLGGLKMGSRRRTRAGFRGRKINPKRGARAGPELHVDESAVAADDPAHGGETKAGALAGILRGDERLGCFVFVAFLAILSRDHAIEGQISW